MTKNNLMLQIQSNILNIPVVKPGIVELTALGSAICAALGSGLFKSVADIPKVKGGLKSFKSEMSEKDRDSLYKKWKLAIQKSVGWVI